LGLATLQKFGPAALTLGETEAAGNIPDVELEQQLLGKMAGGDSLRDVPLPDVPLPHVSLPDVPLPDVPLPNVPLSDDPLPNVPLPDVPLPDDSLSEVRPDDSLDVE